MLIVVCGLSKCGKTSLLVAAAEQGLEVPSVKASHLLRSYNRPTLTLTASEAVSNQAELMQLLAGYAREDLSIILDGHLLIETVDGPQLVPDSTLLPIGLLGIVVVAAPPQIIASRRRDTPFTRDAIEIQELALMETVHARRMAHVASIPFFEVGYLDVRALMKAVSECLRRPRAGSH